MAQLDTYAFLPVTSTWATATQANLCCAAANHAVRMASSRSRLAIPPLKTRSTKSFSLQRAAATSTKSVLAFSAK